MAVPDSCVDLLPLVALQRRPSVSCAISHLAKQQKRARTGASVNGNFDDSNSILMVFMFVRLNVLMHVLIGIRAAEP